MRVESIPSDECVQWILNRHYARRLPCIQFSYGLYHEGQIIGVCTFGQIANYVECKAWEPFPVYELNRLVVEDESPKNSSSYFVARCLRSLPIPSVVISYADFRQGHIGYIYQATNWLYTGIGGEGQRIYVMKDGTERHQRHEDHIEKSLIDRIEYTEGKARYYYFNGNRKEKRKMTSMLRFPVLPYPKGASKRYDASAEVPKQGLLF